MFGFVYVCGGVCIELWNVINFAYQTSHTTNINYTNRMNPAHACGQMLVGRSVGYRTVLHGTAFVESEGP